MRDAPPSSVEQIDGLLAARADASERFFGQHAERIARLCHAMAERFARGGRLIAFGESAADRSDVAHVAVEFVHPVIVGKRALPALGVEPDNATLLSEPDDIAVAFGDAQRTARVIGALREQGCLTLAFADVGAEWEFPVPSDDPFVAQELTETLYHVLWELVHVFFDHRGLLEGREARTLHDTGASSFLYPFLGESQDDLDAVLGDVAASALAKARETSELREQTLSEGADALHSAAVEMRRRLEADGVVLALGNGGSATDAMDAVADFREPPEHRGWPARRALNLAGDASIVTAIANDVGTDAIFARQVIAYGGSADALLAISTSGNSSNVIAALEEGRRRGLHTTALVGYDGGRIAQERLADEVVITRSEHIPRIQEAQASAWHVLRELIEQAPG